MFFTFQFLIILPVVNIMYQAMVFMNPMPLTCMRSQNRVTFLYPSRMPLGGFGTLKGSKLWILWWDVFPCKCGTLVLQISLSFLASSQIIGILCSMLLSTAFRIQFTGCTVLCWNFLVRSSLISSLVVYYFLFSFHCGMGERELFNMMCALFLIFRMSLILCQKTPAFFILKFLQLWDMNNKSIAILTVISHQIMFLHQ